MDLTSWQRLRRSIGGNDPFNDDAINKRKFLNFIPAVSRRIQEFLNRDLELTTHTEHFNTLPITTEYFFENYPITSLTTVETDSTGLYDGSETTETDFYIGIHDSSIVLDSPATAAKKGLRVTYISGLATTATNSQYTLSDLGATEPSVGDFFIGATSLAVGIVTAYVSASLLVTVDILYGVFQASETYTLQTEEESGTITDGTGTISSKDVISLAESFPDIVTACELEIRYFNTNRSQFETQANFRGQTSKMDLTREYSFLPEVRSLLETYRIYSI